jgi:hypothetical protein
VNPTAELAKMPPGEPIAPDLMADFARARDNAFTTLEGRLAPAPATATPALPVSTTTPAKQPGS